MTNVSEGRDTHAQQERHRTAGIMHLLSGRDVAEILDLPPSSVYDYARRRLLPCVKIGRNVRFRPEDVRAFIESGGQALPGGWREEPAEGPA